ncbi:MAG: aminoglycoside phosphotransferase family protein [Clostridiales bacterium]|nr:aminoglycoside phosphotransferase family protein [Clostridiales bacterium]
MSEDNKTSGILEQALKIEKTKKKDSSHFVLCNGDKIRYIIAPDGKKRLSQNISTYSGKLGLLMKYLKYIPFWILEKTGMGYFARIELHSEIENTFKQTSEDSWNIIVGTYDEKQKLVMQCFRNDTDDAIFIKIGNAATEKEMSAEMDFLEHAGTYRTFEVPQMVGVLKANDGNTFNLQLTREFRGEKVEPILTEDIIGIYKEITAIKYEDAAVPKGYTFSHGDFAPWNIKKTGRGYTVFDWEQCGYRIVGYDIMHYVTVIGVALNNFSFEDAYGSGIVEIKKYIPEFEIDKEAFLNEFSRLITQLA